MTVLTTEEIEAIHSTIEMELHPCQSQERASQVADYVRELLQDSQAPMGRGNPVLVEGPAELSGATILWCGALDPVEFVIVASNGKCYVHGRSKDDDALPTWELVRSGLWTQETAEEYDRELRRRRFEQSEKLREDRERQTYKRLHAKYGTDSAA